MTDFKMKPVDDTPLHNELVSALSTFLYNLPVGPRKHRDIQVHCQSASILCLVHDLLDSNGYKIVEK